MEFFHINKYLHYFAKTFNCTLSLWTIWKFIIYVLAELNSHGFFLWVKFTILSEPISGLICTFAATFRVLVIYITILLLFDISDKFQCIIITKTNLKRGIDLMSFIFVNIIPQKSILFTRNKVEIFIRYLEIEHNFF